MTPPALRTFSTAPLASELRKAQSRSAHTLPLLSVDFLPTYSLGHRVLKYIIIRIFQKIKTFLKFSYLLSDFSF